MNGHSMGMGLVMILPPNCTGPSQDHGAAHSFEEVSCVDWRNTLRYEATTKRKRHPKLLANRLFENGQYRI